MSNQMEAENETNEQASTAQSSLVIKSSPKYKCNKCLEDGVETAAVSFETCKLLFDHYEVEHIARDEHDAAGALERIHNRSRDAQKVDSNKIQLASTAAAAAASVTCEIKQEVIVKQQEVLVEETKVSKRKIKNETTSAVTSPKLNGSLRKKKVNFTGGQKAETTEPDSLDIKKQKVEDLTTLDGLQTKLENSSVDELKYLNFTSSQLAEHKAKYDHVVDELELCERVARMYSNQDVKKTDRLMREKIVWATWRHKNKVYMWPGMISRRVSKGKQIMNVRYYEQDQMGQYAFKMEPNKIEPFFKSAQEHFEHKQRAFEMLERRYEFLSAYTAALFDYEKMLSELEQKQPSETPKEEETTKPRFRIDKKELTLDEIKEIAGRELSEKQLKINKERQAKSKALLDVVRSQECQNHVISVLKRETPCPNSDEYLNGDVKTRKRLQQTSPGPLVEEDQLEVAKLVNELSRTHFASKPAGLPNYEHDILYPEAVIWAIRKKYSLAASKALAKYMEAFKRTEEEILKQKCNEFLNERNLKENDSLKQEVKQDEAQLTKSDDSLANLESVNSSLSINTTNEKEISCEQPAIESSTSSDVNKTNSEPDNMSMDQ